MLNETADNVTINRTGDTPLNLGALAKGSHTFSLGSGTGYDIVVSDSTAAGWTQISSDTDVNSKFFSPRGVSVSRNASSPFFGDIYLGNHVGGTTGGAINRNTPEGIYRTRADQTPVTNTTGGVTWGGNNSPWKVSVAPDGQLFIADWSDAHSGIWRAPGDLSGTFPEVLTNAGRVTSGLVAGIHGSVAAVHIQGTGAGTVLYTLDEDLAAAGDVNSYPIGTNATPYASGPTKVTTDSTNVIQNTNMDFVRAPDGSWWITQVRSVGQETALVPGLSRFLNGGSSPVYNSGTDPDIDLGGAGGTIAIDPTGTLLAIGSSAEAPAGRIWLIDISDPTNPSLITTLSETGYIRDLDFDAAGNLYTVNNITETLRIYSPGGTTVATTSSNGTFVLVPEPSSLALLALGGLFLGRRRRG